LGVLQIVYSQDSRTDFDENTSKDAVPRKDVPFGGRKIKTFSFTPLFAPKIAIIVFSKRLRNFRSKTLLTLDM